MKNSNRRWFSVFLAAGVVAMSFMACNNSNASTSDAPSKNQSAEVSVGRNDIVVAVASEPPTLHPYDHKAVTAGYFNLLTYNTLFMVDTETLEPVPSLVKSYELLDEVTWQFTLHEGVMFHDGSSMTTADVLDSMEYARAYPTTTDYSSFWESVEAVDDYTFVVKTKGVYAQTLDNMTSLKIVPSELIASGHDFNANPVGSGPYQFVSQQLGDKIQLKKFDGYFNDEHKPTIQDMIWKIIPEGSSRTIALEAGEVDMVIEVESSDLKRLEESQQVEVLRKEGTRVDFFTMNNEVAPFNNKDFRKAINTAIDKEAVVMVALNGEGSVALSHTPMAFEGASTTNTDHYDLEKAKEYLKKSGVDPTTVQFECIASTDINRRTAEVIQACLKELGIEMSIVSMDYATYLNAIMSGEYQTAVSGYTSNSMAYYLNGLFHSNALNAANLARITDPTLDAFIDLGKTQIDPELRGETFTKATDYINELSPFAPLYTPVITRAYHHQLGGVAVSAAGNIHFEDIYWKN